MFIDGGDVVIFRIGEGLTVSGFSVVILGMGEGLAVSGFPDVLLGIGEGFDDTAVAVVSFGKEEVGRAVVVTDDVEVGGAEVVVLVHFP